MASPPPSSPPTPPPPYQELAHPDQLTSDPALAPTPGSAPSPFHSAPSQLSSPTQTTVPVSPESSQFSVPRKPVPQPSFSSALSPSPAATSSNVQTYNDWKLPPDPRSSSTQSLHPIDPRGYTPTASLSSSSVDDAQGRRTLLIIYIHGFLGNDESFRSFPAHLHAHLTNLLVDSHVIHSKIYPRYKTYRAVDVARDNFSDWLAPHESPTTDVILVGHSMGGILAADIILMPNTNPHDQNPLKHRILGHVSLDCPFLGLHPGIIVSGIQSLFKPAPQPQDATQNNNSPYNLEDTIASPGSSSAHLDSVQPSISGSSASLPSSSSASVSSSLPPHDPHFNPPFFNDAAFREQPFVRRALHFAAKYRSENLFSAATKHFMSYLEYGGVLADPNGLDIRYRRLRALEDVDELQPNGLGKDPRGPTTRVRFVNYYTLCTGRPKSPKPGSPKAESADGTEVGEDVEVLDIQSEPTEAEKATAENSAENHDVLEPKSLVDEKDKIKASSSRNSPGPSITVADHDKTNLFPVNSAPTMPTSSENLDIQSGAASTTQEATSPLSDMSQLSLQEIDPTPMEDDSAPELQEQATLQSKSSVSVDFELDLAPIPDEPTPPELPDLDKYASKDARKQAEKEAKRLQRAYDQAVKDRNKAIHEREKIVEKRRKKAEKAAKEAEKLGKEARKGARKEAERDEKESKKETERLEKEARKEEERREKEAKKEAERKEKEALKEQRRLEKEAQKLEAEALRNQPLASPPPAADTAAAESKPRKLRQFCNLPDPTPSADGGRERDRTWVEVFMADVDEVGAHCGLFVPGPHYERLLGDVGGRILGWVQEDMTKRAILEMG